MAAKNLPTLQLMRRVTTLTQLHRANKLSQCTDTPADIEVHYQIAFAVNKITQVISTAMAAHYSVK
jgi:hypothetical protein